jgi:hypothetical protein
MEGKLLSSLGKIAGIGGIALGIFVLLFQGVLQQKFLPGAGLGPSQAFAVIMSLMLLTFGIAGIGIFAWLISLTTSPERPVPGSTLGALAVLIAVVLGAALYEGAQAKPDQTTRKDEPPPETSQARPNPLPPETSTIAVNYVVCVGEYQNRCPANSVYLYCGASVEAWARNECKSFGATKLSDTGGNKCGYYVAQVTCTKSVSK